MRNDLHIKQLKNEFSHRDLFSKSDLLCFFKNYEPDLKEATFRWRIHDLKQNKIITSLSKEWFTFTYKPVFRPDLEPDGKKLADLLDRAFNGLKSCIWSTGMLHEFMLHQPGRSFTLIEAEADATELVFNALKDASGFDIFLKPQEKELQYYVFEAKSPVIVQNLISKAPVQVIRKNTTATIEKIIVDLYCDDKLFRAFQGTELSQIIGNAYQRYAVNFTTLFSYARRRKREGDLKQFLINETEIPQNILK